VAPATPAVPGRRSALTHRKPLVSISWTVSSPTIVMGFPGTGGGFFSLNSSHTEFFSCERRPGGPGLTLPGPERQEIGHRTGNRCSRASHSHGDGDKRRRTNRHGRNGYTVFALRRPPSLPAAGVYNLNEEVTEAFSCSEGLEGFGLESCLDQNGHETETALEHINTRKSQTEGDCPLHRRAKRHGGSAVHSDHAAFGHDNSPIAGATTACTKRCLRCSAAPKVWKAKKSLDSGPSTAGTEQHFLTH